MENPTSIQNESKSKIETQDRILISNGETPLAYIAEVSRIVPSIVDRFVGPRQDCPLLVASACADALGRLGVKSQVMYGHAAWVEILDDQTPVWAGCWGEQFYFWVLTEFEETVDLNASVAIRNAEMLPSTQTKPLYGPPMLWSKEIPGFFRFLAHGVAEVNREDTQGNVHYQKVIEELTQWFLDHPADLLKTKSEEELHFPNEPILCPGRRLLDDAKQTFLHYDRALGVHQIPKAPF